jgi:hypothetical protein
MASDEEGEAPMKYALVVLTIVLIAPILRCQDAKVVALSPQDAVQAAALDQEQKALDAKRQAFQDHVAKTYLVTADRDRAGNCAYSEPGSYTLTGVTSGLLIIGGSGVFVPSASDPKVSPTRYYLRGWGCGAFRYSDDFKYIVPLPDSLRVTGTGCSLGGMYVTN